MSTLSSRAGTIDGTVGNDQHFVIGGNIHDERRWVRNPLSRVTIADISSSVRRLPFIKSSASPVRTRSAAFAAEAWLWGTCTICNAPRSLCAALAVASIVEAGPTKMGRISPFSEASTAPPKAVFSQGYR
jgi:hypothetical protein